MRGAHHSLVILTAALVAGCATGVDVSYDPRDDFSQYRTWSWMPGGRNVYGLPGSERGLEALTSRLIERELSGHGMLRVDREPDLMVAYDLEVRRYGVQVNETGATEHLSSHHSSPSYQVQSTEGRMDFYDVGSLKVRVTNGRRERMLWRGRVWARRRGNIADHLEGVVARLLDEFPEAAPGAPADPAPHPADF